ncbi:MAG: peptidoglycan-binding domain-containing protein [Polaromonas sp.]|nr:peptidoglycan-binding domain-containing protein [Polaromonas sp.]
MRLEDLAQGGSLPLAAIGGDKALAREMQVRLAAIGLLDLPADGQFGPVSHWALSAFCSRAGLTLGVMIGPSVAEALLSPASDKLFAIKPAASLAGRVVAAMTRLGYSVCRHPDAVNIAYVEGLDTDGSANDNRPNVFNDVRLVLRIAIDGTPELAGIWEGTSEPGRHYTEVELLDPRGAARIALGQFKAWSVGTHNGSEPHEALVQTWEIKVHRDLNKDYLRLNDVVDNGLFGINQHWGYNHERGDIRKASAGCMVGRTKTGHREFMALCKSDPRYMASRAYRFMTTVLPAGELA